MDIQYLDSLKALGLSWVTTYGAKIIVALLILLIGTWISRRLASLTRMGLERKGVDPLLVSFMRKVIYYVLLMVVAIAAISHIGINTTSLLAVFGSLGLAVGLALKDNLANFSSGVMLILFRPFTVGDFVTAGGVSGIIEKISISNTILRTPDNQKIIAPNSKVMGEVITNATANPTRRIDMVVGIDYGSDMGLAKEVLSRLIKEDSRILADPAPVVAVDELADSSVNLVVRPWVNTGDYWAVRFDLTEKMKTALEESGISIPFPQRDVHIIPEAPAQ